MIQRRVNEFVAIKKFHPDLKDVIVEGTDDLKFVSWFLSRQGRNDIRVVDINLIEIPNEAVAEVFGDTQNNNRRRVITLASALGSAEVKSSSCICLIDRDFEDYHVSLPSSANKGVLRLTDFCNMESYIIDPDILEKHLTLALVERPVDGASLLGMVDETLKLLFAVRLVNERDGLKLTWLEPKKYIKVSGLESTLDFDGFILALLTKNGAQGKHVEFLEEVREAREALRPELRYSCHGHDFMYIVAYYLAKITNGKYKLDQDSVAFSLYCCTDDKHLLHFSVFQEIAAM